MPKRFFASEIWEEDWFLDMPNEYRWFWFYMLAKCDHAGIFRVNLRSIRGKLDVELSPIRALELINVEKQRVRVLREAVWLIEDFFVFQYGPKFSPKNRVHVSVAEIYQKYGIELTSIRGLIVPTDGVKDKDKDKVGEEVGGKEDDMGGMGGKVGETGGEQGVDERMLLPQMHSLWKTTFPLYTPDQDFDYPALRSIAMFIFKTAGVKNAFGNVDAEIKVLNTFQLIADQVNREPFWVNKPLASISKNIQEFYNKLKNPQDGNGKAKTAGVDSDKLKQKVADHLSQRRQQNGGQHASG